MPWTFLIILAVPSIIHLFKFPNARADIIIQGLIALGLLFLGWRVLKMGGCLRIIGLVMLVLGIAAYYYLIVQPFFTGQITTFGILK